MIFDKRPEGSGGPRSVLTKQFTRDIVSVRGHHFSARGLGPDAVVLDLGAHRGEFSQALAVKGCRCVAVEANPALSKGISPTERLTVISAAIDIELGLRPFFAHENPEAGSLFGTDDKSTRVEHVRTLTMAEVFEETNIDRVNLVKIDIEGTEVALLASLPRDVLRRCDQITVEFHDFCSEHVKTTDVERVIKRLETCGFYAVSFSRRYTDVLFVRRDAALLSRWEAWYLRFCLRFVYAFLRKLDRARPTQS